MRRGMNMRLKTSLNEAWQFTKGSEVRMIDLPHTWNTMDGQDGGNDYWRGTASYEKTFPCPDLEPGGRAVLEFPGAAMAANVYLNGHHLARHEGGYSTFRVDITDVLEEENRLLVEVDNSANDQVYPQKADFTFYGGLYRDVNLITVPAVHFELCKNGTPGIKVTPVVDLEEKTACVTVETWQNGGMVEFTVNGETQIIPSVDGCAKAEFTIENVHLWDGVDDPYLYTAVAKLDSGDEVTARFGCRKFEIDPQKGFLLNGRSYPLRGVSRHQDCKGMGNALTIEHHRQDMAIVKEIGANTLRLAHYQHAQEFYDLCDENGLIVWAEIPYITQHMENGRQNTLDQMRELIVQNYNHPCIAVWGLSNEITASGPVTDDMLENHRLLNELCHKLDPTRPTTMANVFMLETDSPILDIPDVNSYNLYFGWYLGELEQNEEFFDAYHTKYPNRCIGFSEYGADANPQFHAVTPERGDYTEEYQCLYHEHILALIEERPWLWATHVWNLFDFAADGRDEGGKHGENQKGLVTFDRQTKKDAFYLYKAAWNKSEPFVHLCGRRYVNRAEDVTEVKVYSNQPEVSLYVDGEPFGTQTGRIVFCFRVPISGEHTIRAVAGDCEDSITISWADAPDPAYQFQKEEIVNWFDREELRPDCFSIRDTLGELLAHPEAGAMVERLIQQARASRGDVAQAASGNANLQKMMGRMTLQSILKQAGPAVKPEQIKALNDTLQSIKKE